jgi:hypothetical protein
MGVWFSMVLVLSTLGVALGIQCRKGGVWSVIGLITGVLSVLLAISESIVLYLFL